MIPRSFVQSTGFFFFSKINTAFKLSEVCAMYLFISFFFFIIILDPQTGWCNRGWVWCPICFLDDMILMGCYEIRTLHHYFVIIFIFSSSAGRKKNITAWSKFAFTLAPFTLSLIRLSQHPFHIIFDFHFLPFPILQWFYLARNGVYVLSFKAQRCSQHGVPPSIGCPAAVYKGGHA